MKIRMGLTVIVVLKKYFTKINNNINKNNHRINIL